MNEQQHVYFFARAAPISLVGWFSLLSKSACVCVCLFVCLFVCFPQVEMAYDLLVKRGFGDLEEFADQCKMIVTDIP